MKQISVADYLARIHIDKPLYVVALADEVGVYSLPILAYVVGDSLKIVMV